MGQFAFPNNRSLNYTNNILCEWTIEVPPNFAVDVKLLSINLEKDKKCLYDSISFHDGGDLKSREIGKVCGDIKPTYIRSTGHLMTVVFSSDNSVTSEGFELSWTIAPAVKPRNLCLI